MSDGSPIEWTDATWNPVRGCTKISPGCKHCYAERFAERFRGVPDHPYEQGFDLRLVREKLLEPLQWSRSRRIFVNSMSDLFQDKVPICYIREVCEVMTAANWHSYQVLTKRSSRMRDVARALPRKLTNHQHIWLGVSVEDRKYGVPRIEELRNTPAGVRFLSIEPLLEDLGKLNLAGIDWVIVGGESGLGARDMQKEWVISIRDQCHNMGIPFFFKQWGGLHKARRGRLLDGKTYDEYPAARPQAVPSASLRHDLSATLRMRFRLDT